MQFRKLMFFISRKFFAEVIRTFVVVLDIGSVVIDAGLKGALCIPFIAFASFVGVTIRVCLFDKISIAYFSPAVTLGFLITKHITKKLFLKYVIGTQEYLGANAPSYSYPFLIIFTGGSSLCFTYGSYIGCSLYKRLARIWRTGNRLYGGGIGHILFSLYLWSINESSILTGTCFII
jgi:Major intrinsic protein